jgi:hypothetical protein
MILNRKESRAMENIQEVYQLFASSPPPLNATVSTLSSDRVLTSSSEFKDNQNQTSKRSVGLNTVFQQIPPSNVTMFMTEDQSFETQAMSFARADIVVSIHGAGETNILFMKPCSILIEIYPWQYTPVNFFHGLASKVGMIHEYWEANRTEIFPVFKKEDSACNKHFQRIWLAYQDGIGGRSKNETINTVLAAECTKKKTCLNCARLVPSVYVSIPMLREKLAMGLRKRHACLNRLVKAGIFEYNTD